MSITANIQKSFKIESNEVSLQNLSATSNPSTSEVTSRNFARKSTTMKVKAHFPIESPSKRQKLSSEVENSIKIKVEPEIFDDLQSTNPEVLESSASAPMFETIQLEEIHIKDEPMEVEEAPQSTINNFTTQDMDYESLLEEESSRIAINPADIEWMNLVHSKKGNLPPRKCRAKNSSNKTLKPEESPKFNRKATSRTYSRNSIKIPQIPIKIEKVHDPSSDEILKRITLGADNEAGTSFKGKPSSLRTNEKIPQKDQNLRTKKDPLYVQKDQNEAQENSSKVDPLKVPQVVVIPHISLPVSSTSNVKVFVGTKAQLSAKSNEIFTNKKIVSFKIKFAPIKVVKSKFLGVEIPMEEPEEPQVEVPKEPSLDDSLKAKFNLKNCSVSLHPSNILLSSYDVTYITCYSCPNIFYTTAAFAQHFKDKHTNDDGTFSCHLCTEKFPSFRLLQAHIAIHWGGPKYQRFQCTQCEENFNHKQKLMRHLLEKHSVNEAFDCEFCPANFSNPKTLEIHVKKYHSQKEFACEICNISYSDGRMFERHMKAMHSELKCIFCGREFGRKSELDKHYDDKHFTVEEMKCFECEMKVRVEADEAIKIYERDRAFRCSSCGERRRKRIEMKEEMKKNESELEKFKEKLKKEIAKVKSEINFDNGKNGCFVCGAQMATKMNLHKHLQRHLDTLFVTCSVCLSIFPSHAEMLDHFTSSHEFQKKSFCVMCQKEFSALEFSAHLESHMKEKSKLQTPNVGKILAKGKTSWTIDDSKMPTSSKLQRLLNVEKAKMKSKVAFKQMRKT